MTIQVRARQHDTMDLLCWRHLGSTAGIVEAALELNRNALQPDAILPHGQLVTLPDPPVQRTPAVPLVQLWD